MKETPIPENEDARISALRRFTSLEAGSNEVFEDLTNLVSEVCGVPISLISLVDKDELKIQASVGLPGVTSMPRQDAFCSHAILENDTLVIPDVKADERFQENSSVKEENGVQFYAGSPLTTSDGYNLGTLCIMDRQPRQMTEQQLKSLKIIGRQVMSQLELRYNLSELANITRKAVALENLIKKYTSQSVWESADLSVSSGQLDITDEEVERAYLFIDVVSFTRLSEKLGAKGTVELLNSYFKAMVDIIIEKGGDIDKFVGDQIFCSFQSCNAAVDAALGVKEKLAEINIEREARNEVILNFTMGMSSGKAIRANVGGHNRRDNTFIGNVVNIAARLQGACESGGLLITDELYEHVKHEVQVVKSNKYKLKNLESVIRGHYVERVA